MDRRKLRLILLGIAGILILVIGIGAAHIYTNSPSLDARNQVSQLFYGKNYDELNSYAKSEVDSLLGVPPDIQQQNAQFREWLVKWIAKPLGIFFAATAVLTAALVLSRVISNKIRPPTGPSGD
jgi:hypothetical protein